MSQVRSQMRVFLKTLQLRTVKLAAAALADSGDEVPPRDAIDEEPAHQQLQSELLRGLCDFLVKASEDTFHHACPDIVSRRSRLRSPKNCLGIRQQAPLSDAALAGIYGIG